MKRTKHHRNFLAVLETQAEQLKSDLASRALKPNPAATAMAIHSIREDWLGAPIFARRTFVTRHLPEVGSKAAFARALEITRNRFRYLIEEG